jgi:hypothetical protein
MFIESNHLLCVTIWSLFSCKFALSRLIGPKAGSRGMRLTNSIDLQLASHRLAASMDMGGHANNSILYHALW